MNVEGPISQNIPDWEKENKKTINFFILYIHIVQSISNFFWNAYSHAFYFFIAQMKKIFRLCFIRSVDLCCGIFDPDFESLNLRAISRDLKHKLPEIRMRSLVITFTKKCEIITLKVECIHSCGWLPIILVKSFFH